VAHKALRRLKERREELGFTQAQLAEQTGVNPSYIGLLERGERVPSLDVLVELVAALDLSLTELFDDDKPRATEMPELGRIRKVLERWPAERRTIAVAVLIEMDKLIPSRAKARS